jgi:hypothetical protein
MLGIMLARPVSSVVTDLESWPAIFCDFRGSHGRAICCVAWWQNTATRTMEAPRRAARGEFRDPDATEAVRCHADREWTLHVQPHHEQRPGAYDPEFEKPSPSFAI